MLHRSETWPLGLNEIGILQRAERCMVRNMCADKLIDRKSTNDLMQALDLNESIDQLAKANSVRWYGHILRKNEKNFLRKNLDYKVRR